MILKPEARLDLGDHPCGLKWSVDGLWLGAGSLNGKLALIRSGFEHPCLWQGHEGGVLDFAWTAEGDLVSVGEDGRLCWWSTQGECLNSLSLGKGWAEHVLPCGEGRLAASLGRTLSIWRQDGTQVGENLELPSTIAGLCVNPKESHLAVAHYGGVSFVDPTSAQKVIGLEWKGSLLRLAWSPKGQWLAASSQEQGVIGFDLKDNKNCGIDNFPGKVHAMSWSPDGDWLAMAGGDELLVWPFDGPGPIDRIPLARNLEESSQANWTALSFHSNRNILAAGDNQGHVEIFEEFHKKSGSLVTFRECQFSQPIAELAWHPSGETLAVADQHGKVAFREGLES